MKMNMRSIKNELNGTHKKIIYHISLRVSLHLAKSTDGLWMRCTRLSSLLRGGVGKLQPYITI